MYTVVVGSVYFIKKSYYIREWLLNTYIIGKCLSLTEAVVDRTESRAANYALLSLIRLQQLTKVLPNVCRIFLGNWTLNTTK